MILYVEIDGALGGGQVLRTSLALSLCTGKPFRITHIRAGRKKPGLLNQHLTAVHAARDISGAELVGDTLGSTSLTLLPQQVNAGHYHFSVGTAGSTTLVLQTILYPLLLAQGESHLILEGGTHNPQAPPFEFLEEVFLPLLNQQGPQVKVTLKRHGFYPRGGGQILADILPTSRLSGLSLLEKGKLLARQVKVLLAGLPEHIARRELQQIAKHLKWSPDDFQTKMLPADLGPGNILLIKLRNQNVTELFSGFGQRRIPAETVADQALAQVETYLASKAPVGEYLADQLLLPLALAGEGEFITLSPSHHMLTNIAVIQKFLPISITTIPVNNQQWKVQVGTAG